MKIPALLASSIIFSPASFATVPDSVGAVEELREVVVSGTSARQRLAETRLGAERLDLPQLAQAPAMFGENDIIKSIALMPGVHGEGDGSGGFEVRGGTAAQNLILLDGITLYNPSHVMGIFSTFNDKAIGSATLFKGPIPAAYGNATASVLETNLAAGDMERYHASGSIGILAAKAMVGGPIVKEKLSFALTARRSYVDAFLMMVPQYRGTVMNFYDVTAKVRYEPRQGDRIEASFIVGHDNMAIKQVMGMYWGNLGGSLNWVTYRNGGRLSFTTTASATDYAPDMEMTMMDSEQRMREFVRSYSINEKMRVTLSDTHTLEAGVRSELLRVKSADMEFGSSRMFDIRSGWQNAIWLTYDGSFGRHFSMSAGMRLSIFSALHSSTFNGFAAHDEPAPDFSPETYVDAEPRLSLKYVISPLHNLKAGVGLTTQNLHAIRSSATSFPFDRYALTSATVRPERAVQYGLGYAGMSPRGDFDWSVEGYYKSIDNVYDYMDGRTMFSKVNLESIILGGRGRSYGAEFMLRKNTGRLSGWLSYTISRTQSKIPGINGGQWYNATNDRRHDFSVTAIFRLTGHWNLSGSWVYSSGQPLTAPDVKYELSGVTCYYYSRRNGYRTPPTHRLDLAATYTRRGRHFTTQWAFGLYNAYCRYNPYIVYFEDDPSKPSGTRAVQQALFGIVPSVSYSLSF